MNLTKRMLCEGLTQTERMYLLSMTHHDGFPVLQKMFDDICRLATAEVMKIKSTDKDYKEVLAATQTEARCIHEFCESVRKSFLAHIENAVNEVEAEAGKEERRRSAN